jgi:Uma2 family endonuclease
MCNMAIGATDAASVVARFAARYNGTVWQSSIDGRFPEFGRMATVQSDAYELAEVQVVPALYAGDRLTRAEFERRYSSMPDVKKAELIEGVVYMPSPVSRKHSGPHALIIGWLIQYFEATPGVEVEDNATVRLDLENEPQPDALLRIAPALGGQSHDSGEYVGGAPELVAEVANTRESYDLHDKLRAYQRNGVREYVVWRVADAAIDWFVLRNDRYERMQLDTEGRYRSEVFPGLWLDPVALVQGDMARHAAVRQQGIVSPEHAEFAAELAHRGSGKT